MHRVHDLKAQMHIYASMHTHMHVLHTSEDPQWHKSGMIISTDITTGSNQVKQWLISADSVS